MVGRLLRGITVDDRTLAVDLIQEVGPIPGHFLNKRHTKDSWKQEQLVPALADRMPYPEWVRQGKKDILALAKEKYNDILAKYEPMPVTAEQEKEIQKILNAAGI